MIETTPVQVTSFNLDQINDGVEFSRVLSAYTDNSGNLTTLATGQSPDERIVINEPGYPNTIRFYSPTNQLVGSIYGGETIDNGQTFYGILTEGYAFSDTGFIGLGTSIIGTGGFYKVALQTLYTSTYHSAARMVFGFNLTPSLLTQQWTTAGFGTANNEGYGIVITGGHGDHAGSAGDYVFYTVPNTGTYSSRVLTDDEELANYEVFRVSKDGITKSKYAGFGIDGSTSYRISLPSGTTSADGIIWGSDTTLYRKAANNLATDDLLSLANNIANPTTNAYGITFGGASAGTPDVFLYRAGTNYLALDADRLDIIQGATDYNGGIRFYNSTNYWNIVQGADNRLFFGYNSSSRVIFDDPDGTTAITLGPSGGISWMTSLGGTSVDVNLYRSATGILKTDDNFSALTLDAANTASSYDILKIRNTAAASNSNYAGLSFYLQDDAPGEVLYGRIYVVSTSSVNPDDEGTLYIDLNNYGSMTTGLTLTASGGLSIASTVTCPYIIGTTQVRAKSSDTSASTPGFSWNDDSDTGFFKPASNTIGVTVGNSEKFRFDANGRLNVTTNVAGPTTNTYGLTLGGASAGSPDTYLYRSAASTLRTNSNLVVDGTLSVNGTTVTGKSYVLQGGAAMLSPANATNYYWGAHPATTPWTYATPGKIYIPKDGTLKYILVSVYHTNITWAVSSGSWIMYYRYNNGSSVQIESRTSQNSNYYSYWTASGLSLSVTAGSYIEIHELTPTFSTNPSNCYRAVVMYIE